MTAHRSVFCAFAALLCSAQGVASPPPPPSPQQIYGPLFEAVQREKVFPDGKTFVDAVPRGDPATILDRYSQEKPQGPALRSFVLQYFDMPGEPAAMAAQSLRGHIKALWPQLTRPALSPPVGSSALALPARYVVPGGRFREIYYWDSYFTMLGLKADGQQPLIDSMLVDFESLIDRYGFIPNGTRTYYLGRSQPPFLALMVDLASNPDNPRHLKALRAEHDFWMRGAEGLATGATHRRVVRMPDGALLNRYWDDRPGPRDESWAEDVATAGESNRPAAAIYRHLRAGAESGWDFSSRWLDDPRRLSTIRTTDIVPVDLNSLLWSLERAIARRCAAAGDAACARQFESLATARAKAITRWLWQARDGRYADWDMLSRKPTAVVSAATLFPLFVGLADRRQADALARLTRDQLLGQGGLRTTRIASGQQWDSPNGWAPLQWVAVEGLARTGHEALARDIARRWIGTVDAAWRETGKMLEKYDVEARKPGGGGEYALQDGFGWTNGVTSALIERWPDLDPDTPVAAAR
ncbi:Periplasmic trehalase [Sphingobium sp. AntQ-1]|uniref:alpha,alpha-trehalase TreA n=1 Tax=Sphingobium sp. AntQ-1 TaxID=2930091 RepID=UPI00234EAF23|nr:alpha,alpha-trehalase TreA [Sphingobium sp. AntQ-1]WCP14172.1 Periplasmic trehalase [Sphingobium sp. AntQ-1]